MVVLAAGHRLILRSKASEDHHLSEESLAGSMSATASSYIVSILELMEVNQLDDEACRADPQRGANFTNCYFVSSRIHAFERKEWNRRQSQGPLLAQVLATLPPPS